MNLFFYFDSLKTSSMEGQATTVYAQGGRGNARLIAWEGERTVTFMMEDALISPMGFSVLTGAGLVTANEDEPIIMHKTEITDRVVKENDYVEIILSEVPYLKRTMAERTEIRRAYNYNSDTIYYKDSQGSTIFTIQELEEEVFEMARDTLFTTLNGTTFTPVEDSDTFNPNRSYYTFTGHNVHTDRDEYGLLFSKPSDYFVYAMQHGIAVYAEYLVEYQQANDKEDFIYVMVLDENGDIVTEPYIAVETMEQGNTIRVYGTEITDYQSDISTNRVNDISKFTTGCTVLVDYYVAKTSNSVYQIDITPDKFGGNFYLEASTLFRAKNGVDMPAEFIIPNCKIQSNFTFTMASSGDPSTFTFTMDAFPDYTRWDKTKKVFAAIQVIEDSDTLANLERLATPYYYYQDPFKHITYYDSNGVIKKREELNGKSGYFFNKLISSEDIPETELLIDYRPFAENEMPHYFVTDLIDYNPVKQNLKITGLKEYDDIDNYLGYESGDGYHSTKICIYYVLPNNYQGYFSNGTVLEQRWFPIELKALFQHDDIWNNKVLSLDPRIFNFIESLKSVLKKGLSSHNEDFDETIFNNEFNNLINNIQDQIKIKVNFNNPNIDEIKIEIFDI